MANTNYPSDLSAVAWERATKSLKKSTSFGIIGNALKALAKDHEKADFDTADAARAVAADQAEAMAPKAAAAAKALAALAADAKAVEALAKRLESELKKDGQPVDVAKDLGKTSAAYAAAIQRAATEASGACDVLAKKVAEAKAAAKAAAAAPAKAEPAPDKALLQLAERIKSRTLGAFKAVCRPNAPPMPFVLAVGPKKCLLSMGPSVSASEKNQLMKLVTEDGTRYYPGTCTWDKAGSVFVFAGPSLPAGAGLGAKLQKNLVLQIGKKVRVRVMQPDGTADEGPQGEVDGFDDVDEDDAKGDDGLLQQLEAVLEKLARHKVEATPVAAEVAKRSAAARAAITEGNDVDALKAMAFLEAVAERLAQPRSPAPATAGATAPAGNAEQPPVAAPKPPPAPPLSQASPAQNPARLQKLQEVFGPTAPVMATEAGQQIRDRLERAQKALDAGDAAAAKKEIDALDMVAKTLAAKKVAPAKGGKVLFTQSRLRWDEARKKVQAELRKLEASIVAAARGEPDFDSVVAQARGLYSVLDRLDAKLIDHLDDAYTANDPADEAKAREAARQAIDRYRSFVDTDPLMIGIDDNPFGKVDVRGSVLDALNDLQSRLAA